MILNKTELEIAQTAEDVWAYAADIRRHPDWMAVTSATTLRGEGSAMGDRGRGRIGLGPFQWDVEFTVTEAIPGRRIVWRSDGGDPGDLEVALDLEPIGPTSTRARYGSAVQPRGRWRLLTPLLLLEGNAGLEQELARLKENVELHP